MSAYFLFVLGTTCSHLTPLFLDQGCNGSINSVNHFKEQTFKFADVSPCVLYFSYFCCYLYSSVILFLPCKVAVYFKLFYFNLYIVLLEFSPQNLVHCNFIIILINILYPLIILFLITIIFGFYLHRVFLDVLLHIQIFRRSFFF